MEMLCWQRKDRTGVFSVTLKKYFPAVTLRPTHETLHLCGTFFEKHSIINQILKRMPEPCGDAN